MEWKTKIMLIIATLLLSVGIYQAFIKPLPEGISLLGEEYYVPESSVTFLADETYLDDKGVRQSKQEIFDEVFRMIDGAHDYILVDMFLYNDFQGEHSENTRALSGELTEALIKKKKEAPNITIIVVTDPINTIYGGQISRQFKQLEEFGIIVVMTDLKKLRDGNPIYSSFWRVFVQWFGNNSQKGFLVNPFDYNGHFVTVRSYLSMLNFKANHRKLIIADSGKDGVRKLSVLVMSANPHDGSSAHSNVAIKVDDQLWKDAIVSEQSVGNFSSIEIPSYPKDVNDETGDVKVQLLTESKIRDRLIELLNETKEGDEIDMVMFYFSDRAVIKALRTADMRGVSIRLVLDPNKDAFNYEKNGIPNRSVAHELLKNSTGNIKLRWCDTNGEQCHSKLVLIKHGEDHSMVAGSANLTRRNLGDYNLETNILVSSTKEIASWGDARAYVNRIWNNESGHYTADYEKYRDELFLKTVLYRIMEKTGLSSF